MSAEDFIVDSVAIRIKHNSCPKCGSKNIEIVWRCEDPDVVSYECLDCKTITKESAHGLLRRMGDSMQIESLWKFNAKFDPRWQPRFLVYDAAEHLLPIALAMARAESFWELPLIGRFLVPAGD